MLAVCAEDDDGGAGDSGAEVWGADMTPEERALLREVYDAMKLYYSYFASEFRVSTDPPDTEYADLCRRAESALAHESAPRRQG